MHADLTDDEVSHFLREVGERVLGSVEDELGPDRLGWWADSLGYGYRSYRLWYSSPPWSEWAMSYRIGLRRRDDDENADAAPWQAYVGFTYLKEQNERLEWWLEGTRIPVDHTTPTDLVEDQNGRVVEEYGVIEASLDGDNLDELFAATLTDTLTRLIEKITPAVEAFDLERRDRADEVTIFLRGVGDLLTENLPDELKPDGNSGWADRSGDRRFYRFWYSREPWSSQGLAYEVSLFPRDEVGEMLREEVERLRPGEFEAEPPWRACVDFSYQDIGSEDPKTRLERLHVHDGQTVDMGMISVSFPSDVLDEPFSRTLADALGRFIETTPVLDSFENGGKR